MQKKKICMQKSTQAASIYTLCCNGITMEILEQIPNAVNMEKTKKRAEGNFTKHLAATKHWVDSSLSDESIKKLRSKSEEEDAVSISKIFWRQLKLSQV